MKNQMTTILPALILFITTISFAEQNTDSEVGRYQIYFSPIARADAYLVDTKTGKVWTNIQYEDVQGEPRVWKYQERIDSQEDFIKWLKEQKLIQAKE